MKQLFFLVFIIILSFSIKACSPDAVVINISEEIIKPKTYKIPRIKNTIIIDGKADDEDWEKVKFTDDFVDIEGKKIPLQKTNVKMLWDNEFLYIYVKLEENHIWGNLKKRDTIIFYNNDFEVFISPSNSYRSYGELEINALGTVWDLLLDSPYKAKGIPIFNWNIAGLKSAVYVEGTLNNPNDIDRYWSVEFAIPMKALIELKRFQRKLPVNGEQWRINFSRVEWQYDLIDNKYYRKKKDNKFLAEYNWVWSQQGKINMHLPENWGYIEFVENEFVDDEFTHKTDFLIDQIAYVLYRKVAYEEYNHLKNLAAGTKTTIILPGLEEKNLSIHLLNTFAGFEIQIKDNSTEGIYTIDENGFLDRPLDIKH